MNTIKQVSAHNFKSELELLGASRVYAEFKDGKKVYFDIKIKDGKRGLYLGDCTREDYEEVKKVARSEDGTWHDFGYEEIHARNTEIIEAVESGKAHYTFDDEGEITGCKFYTNEPGFAFTTAHGLEG